MNKHGGSKLKFDRRIGEELVRQSEVKCDSAFESVWAIGAKIKTGASGFRVRMVAKQKLKFHYSNLAGSKLRKRCKRALCYGGGASHDLVRVLESRLGALAYGVG